MGDGGDAGAVGQVGARRHVRDRRSVAALFQAGRALMGLLGWVLMGLAIWHFTIWLPDRFWGGIVGALLGSIAGSIVVGLIIFAIVESSFGVPGEKATDVAVVLYAVPGAIVGIAVAYFAGARRERDSALQEDGA
jgi:hypothetical protein